MMRDVLTQANHADAMAFAVVWAMSRLCYRLLAKGILPDSEIEEVFDPAQVPQSLREEYREIMLETIQYLQDYCLGRTPNLPTRQ